ncbi:MAG: hypothetical protein ACK502_09845 [Alphaproteobacteria bacterium]
MARIYYDLTKLDECKSLLNNLLEVVDDSAMTAQINKQWEGEEAENQLAEYRDNVRAPLQRALALLDKAEDITTKRMNPREKLDYEASMQGQKKLSEQLAEAFEDKTFEQIAERAASIARNIEDKTYTLEQQQKKKDTGERHEDIQILGDLSSGLRRIEDMSQKAKRNFDTMTDIGAISKLHTKLEDFERSIERGRRKG